MPWIRDSPASSFIRAILSSAMRIPVITLAKVVEHLEGVQLCFRSHPLETHNLVIVEQVLHVLTGDDPGHVGAVTKPVHRPFDVLRIDGLALGPGRLRRQPGL